MVEWSNILPKISQAKKKPPSARHEDLNYPGETKFIKIPAGRKVWLTGHDTRHSPIAEDWVNEME